jgi:4-amino-4-deoxy-L-arabinose transferase-like glycosyltransferase
MIDQCICTKKVKRLTILALIVVSAITSFWMLKGKTLDPHESFVSVTAREMVENQDPIWPTYNGNPRLQKTPLSYWLVAGLSLITGNTLEFTSRFPSALFAFASVFIILYYVNRWIGFRTAALAAAFWATSLGFIRYAHNARPDMVMSILIMTCYFTFFEGVNTDSPKRRKINALIFWLAFAIANLAKGPAPIPLVIFPLFVYTIAFKRFKRALKMMPILGPAIFIAIVAPWPLAIASRLDWNLTLWKNEFFLRFFGEYAKGEYPIYYYFIIIFKYTCPWVVFVPMALTAPFYKVWGSKQPFMKAMWAIFIAGFIFLTIAGGKRQHYILPIMPILTILIAITAEDLLFINQAYSKRFTKNIITLHALLFALTAYGCIIYIGKTAPDYVFKAMYLAVISLIALAVATLLYIKDRKIASTCAVFLGIAIWFIFASLWFTTTIDSYKYLREFARNSKKIIPKEETCVAFKSATDIFVTYFERVVPEIHEPKTALMLYEQGQWLFCKHRYQNDLKTIDHLRPVYHHPPKEVIYGKKNMGRTLFHKSAPIFSIPPGSKFDETPAENSNKKTPAANKTEPEKL